LAYAAAKGRFENQASMRPESTKTIALRETFPGDYLIVSRATGRRILFTSKDGTKRQREAPRI
jgi:hypothetical protein